MGLLMDAGVFDPAPLNDPLRIVIGLLCSFVLSQLVAWTYIQTYRGFSYARSFVHALILSSLATAIVVGAIGDSVALGLGVLGALTVIRFRTQIRDARDIVFLFACLGIGLASGAGAYMVATAGCIAFCMVAFYLALSPFASLHTYEGLVRAVLTAPEAMDRVQQVFAECCQRAELDSVREGLDGTGNECTWQVRLRDPSYRDVLVNRLRRLEHVEEASLVMQRATVEI
ncbi:MAG: DUF4956 domain-containing protein [Planctomycetota bacterium]